MVARLRSLPLWAAVLAIVVTGRVVILAAYLVADHAGGGIPTPTTPTGDAIQPTALPHQAAP